MSKLFTIYRAGEKADMFTLEEYLEADFIGESLAEVPEHVRQAIDDAIDDETAEMLARYGIHQ